MNLLLKAPKGQRLRNRSSKVSSVLARSRRETWFLVKATSAVTVEVVKPGTMTLMSLPSKVDGADAAITFQDWLEISATVMADISEVVSYQKHLQAELEAMMTAKSASGKTPPKVQAVEPTLQPKARDAGGKTGINAELCKYFSRPGGCRRGEKCTYSHSMQGMDREQRAKKCLKCGSESHRQRECPVGKPRNKEFRLVANQLGIVIRRVQRDKRGMPHRLLPQLWRQYPLPQRPQAKVLRLTDIRVCASSVSTTALVDSGATHSLRTAKSQEEWAKASEVIVQLAGNHRLTMRITEAGTLIMPYREKNAVGSHVDGLPAQTIVPMGQLIQTLGYTMVWSRDVCYLESQEGERIQLQLDGGCPQLRELEALSLIARLEDRRLEELNNAVMITSDKLKASAIAVERSWEFYLMDYIQTGSFESGLRAVRDAPFFTDVPGEALTGLVPAAGLWSGWDIMKELGFLTRAQRRKILNSKRWVVHLCAGQEGHWEVFKLDKGDTTVIELDKARCQGQDIMRDPTWRMLLWGAKEGKIDAILGGPPGRTQQHGQGGHREVKDVALVTRMMWLHSVAQAGREINGTPRSRNRDVGFVLEYPEGRTDEARRAEEEVIAAREAEVRDPTAGPQVASWNESVWYWQHVQHPRLLQRTGGSTMDASFCFWDTRLWKSYQREMGLQMVSFEQGAMGSLSRNRTTLGTNVNSLTSLGDLRLPEDSDLPERAQGDSTWSPGLVQAIVVAMSFWDRDPICAPRIQAMSPTQWKRHVESNHEVYNKECATCVTSRGTGAQHRRVHHPEAYVLTADVAGPIKKGLDPTSKGTMGRNLKYLLVAKYMVPKDYVKLYTGRKPPEGDGVEEETCGPENRAHEDDVDVFGLEDLQGVLDGKEDKVEIQQWPDELDTGGGILPSDAEEYEPSLPGEEDPEEQEEDEDITQKVVTDQVMQDGDCVPPDMTFLTFAVGLPNNQSGTIKQALQDVVLYLEGHGFPIYRFHADKGEFFNHQFRTWLRERGILGTWSEPGVRQTNAQAETTVRWIKDRTRTLLRSASLPVTLWPVAAATAAAQQRAKVLCWKSLLAAPFGAKVYIKKKAFDKNGPLRREQAMDSKWLKGRYAGLSTILHHGHLVYIPAEGEEKEKFLHTLHVRPNLVDPGEPEMELVVEPDKPRRRVCEKTPVGNVEMKAVELQDDDLIELATTGVRKVLDTWSFSEAQKLVVSLAHHGFFEDKKFGLYRHGGAVGWMKGVKDFPDLVKLLARMVVEVDPEATFTSMLVSYNTKKHLHKDFNNDLRTSNYVIPLQVPERGGEIWTELMPGDYVKGEIEQRMQGDKQRYGQKLGLVVGESIKFSPRCTHEVCDWEGDRVVLIAYSPQCLGKLGQEDLTLLHDYGFPIPLSQLPEFYDNPEAENWSTRVHKVEVEEAMLDSKEINVESSTEWTMYMELDDGLVKVADSRLSGYAPQMRKTEVVYTPNIEEILRGLTSPLDVTYTINPVEVLGNLEAWRPAIEKELRSIEVAIDRLLPGSDNRRRWLRYPGVQRLPTKFVFTVKPNDQADIANPMTWFKRKARLVVCGNMAVEDGASVYTEAAPAEAVRAGLAITVEQKWVVAVLDVVAAFLRTPMGRNKADPTVIVQPPKLLEAMGLVAKLELWGLIRALYGLRQSPALWGDYRDHILRSTKPPEGLKLCQGCAATSWWKVIDGNDVLAAIILVYVDDFLICGPPAVVAQISAWIRQIWDTSDPTFLKPGTSIRFLGMELHTDENAPGEISIGQQGYIHELLRLHQVGSTELDKIPVSKELVADREAEGKSLVMFSDAAFAPMGGRSHGGWAIMYAGTPIMWRSGRQAMITLSTAEAELLAVIDGAIAMKGIEALLNDMGVFMEEKKIASDSMAALSITSGSSSWRTRHLKIKAAWIQEQIAHKEFTTVHWPGERQPADLLTKALSSARLGYLLQWWRVGEHVTPTQVAMSRPMVSSRALVAIICCLLLVSVRAADDDEDQSRSSMGGHLQLHQDTAGILMILLMVLGIMAVWEMIRWVLIEICTEWTPGANARRLRRLQKLQAATTAAIEGELSRLQSLEAKEYLEHHGIFSFVQAVLQAVIEDQPNDPYRFMARLFLDGGARDFTTPQPKEPKQTQEEAPAPPCDSPPAPPPPQGKTELQEAPTAKADPPPASALADEGTSLPARQRPEERDPTPEPRQKKEDRTGSAEPK
ncbi:GIP [Symbiodinium sp. KB8]|nr:GIP [Symbiodinium sp. KB8]